MGARRVSRYVKLCFLSKFLDLVDAALQTAARSRDGWFRVLSGAALLGCGDLYVDPAIIGTAVSSIRHRASRNAAVSLDVGHPAQHFPVPTIH